MADAPGRTTALVSDLRALMSNGVTSKKVQESKELQGLRQFAPLSERGAGENAFAHEVKSVLTGTCTELVGDFVVRGPDRQSKTVTANAMGEALMALLGLRAYEGQLAEARFEVVKNLLGIESPYHTLRRSPYVGEWLAYLAESLIKREGLEIDEPYRLTHGDMWLVLNEHLQIVRLQQKMMIEPLRDGRQGIRFGLHIPSRAKLKAVHYTGDFGVGNEKEERKILRGAIIPRNARVGEPVMCSISIELERHGDRADLGYARETYYAEPRWRWSIDGSGDPDYVWHFDQPTMVYEPIMYEPKNLIQRDRNRTYKAAWSGLPARYWHGIGWSRGRPWALTWPPDFSGMPSFAAE